MLGALSLKWKWRERREADGKATDKPNLVFGGDVHVVWEKFCRYFDVEPRIVPLQPGKYTIGPEDVEPHIDENTIGVAAVARHHLHRPRRRHRRDQRLPGRAEERQGPRRPAARRRRQRRLRLAVPLPGLEVGLPARAGALDQRLRATSSGLSTRASAGSIFREKSDLAEDLVFYENYLGKTDATFTLNFSTGSSMVLAQYYNFVRFGKAGYRWVMETMQENAEPLAERHRGSRQVPDHRRGRGAAAAGRLQPRRGASL